MANETRARRRQALLAHAGTLFAQFALTALGVYLGLRADQWRDDRQRRELTRQTIANFEREIRVNRAEVARHVAYHQGVAQRVGPILHQYLASRGPVTIDSLIRGSGFDGTKADEFTSTAWDLSIATQALSYLDPALAFDLAAVYKRQQSIERFGDQYLESLLGTNTLAARDVSPGLLAMENYFRETARDEESLLAAYDSVAARLSAQR